MKILLYLSIILLVAGCSKSPFSTDMKGIGFWEGSKTVASAFEQKDITNTRNNLSLSVYINHGKSFDGYQIEFITGMGKHELMEERIEKKHKSLFRKEDITQVEWNESDSTHAEGTLAFDSFFGKGTVNFKSLNHNGEWVINHMEFPSVDGTKKPLVIFSYSEDELTK